MNYVFFDIECSDGNHMCSFGYIVVNDKFEVLKKEDIVINPQWRFKLGRAGFDPRIHLAYDEDTFRNQKPFYKHYDKIKNILTAEENTILGHAISSDLQFLTIACERYNLPQIDIQVYDTQDFYYQYNKQYKFRSLENIIKDLELDTSNLIEHKSCDDAEISMLMTKEICKRLEISLSDLLNLCSKSIKSKKEKPKKIDKNNTMYLAMIKALNKNGLKLKDFD